MRNRYVQSLEGLRACNLVGEMAVVGNNCWFISGLSNKAANIPVDVDQTKPVLLYIAIKSALLATSSMSKYDPDEHNVVVPNLVVKGAWLHDWCGHGRGELKLKCGMCKRKALIRPILIICTL